MSVWTHILPIYQQLCPPITPYLLYSNQAYWHLTEDPVVDHYVSPAGLVFPPPVPANWWYYLLPESGAETATAPNRLLPPQAGWWDGTRLWLSGFWMEDTVSSIDLHNTNMGAGWFDLITGKVIRQWTVTHPAYYNRSGLEVGTGGIAALCSDGGSGVYALTNELSNAGSPFLLDNQQAVVYWTGSGSTATSTVSDSHYMTGTTPEGGQWLRQLATLGNDPYTVRFSGASVNAFHYPGATPPGWNGFDNGSFVLRTIWRQGGTIYAMGQFAFSFQVTTIFSVAGWCVLQAGSNPADPEQWVLKTIYSEYNLNTSARTDYNRAFRGNIGRNAFAQFGSYTYWSNGYSINTALGFTPPDTTLIRAWDGTTLTNAFANPAPRGSYTQSGGGALIICSGDLYLLTQEGYGASGGWTIRVWKLTSAPSTWAPVGELLGDLTYWSDSHQIQSVCARSGWIMFLLNPGHIGNTFHSTTHNATGAIIVHAYHPATNTWKRCELGIPTPTLTYERAQLFFGDGPSGS